MNEVSESGQLDLSIVIPIHNEEGILTASVAELHQGLGELEGNPTYELILAENGSRDNTLARAEQLQAKYPEVRIISLPEPNYGAALRRGILTARGRWVICDEIDLCDLDFYRRALALLKAGEADLVVGSKAMAGARDSRPPVRRAATVVINGMLRVLTGFTGTDTHGLKAFRADRLTDVARRCIVEKDLFASEFVIRAQRSGLRVREIPVQIVEKRKPSVDLFRRVPNVLRNLAVLFYVFRVRRDD
jgi:glycosyltransferase involved in cell wall biosynthesis